MKRSGFKRKAPMTDAQRQVYEAHREVKREMQRLRISRSRTGAIGSYYNGEWIPSKWELECRKKLHWMEKAGEIENLRKDTITFSVFNSGGLEKKLQIEIDFCFYHKGLSRHCRWDAKPPKVVHTRHGRRYPQKIHAGWMERFELLRFCEPDYSYRILEKGNTYEGIDI